MSTPELRIGLKNDQRAFRPGETLQGAAGWQWDQPPESAEVRLYWRTEGKGVPDVAVVAVVPFEQPAARDARPFQFQLPEGPYSFSGRLISLIWGVELVLHPGPHAARAEFVLSPTGEEILLYRPHDVGA